MAPSKHSVPPVWAHKWCRNCAKRGTKRCDLYLMGAGAVACSDYEEKETQGTENPERIKKEPENREPPKTEISF